MRILTKTTILLSTFMLISIRSFADPGMNASIENVHLWRGGEVAGGFVLTTDLYFTNADEHLKIGFWGGTNSVGEYKEFNYYASYNYKGFSLAVADTYNFSTYATYNNEEFFNYRASESGRFIDVKLRYQFGDKFPLNVGWSTIIFGRDRNASNSENRYSTYCDVIYPLYKRNGWQVDAGVGAAFTLRDNDNKANFYGDRAGVVEISLKASHALTIRKYEIPIYVLAMLNPQSNEGYLQLCAQVITF